MTQGLWCFCCASLFASESHATQCLTTAELSIISGEPPEGLLEVDVLGSKRNSHAVASLIAGTVGTQAHPKYKQISLVWLRPYFRLDRLWKTSI